MGKGTFNDYVVSPSQDTLIRNVNPHASELQFWRPAVMAPSYGRMTCPYPLASVARAPPSAFRLVSARCRMARNSGNTKAYAVRPASTT